MDAVNRNKIARLVLLYLMERSTAEACEEFANSCGCPYLLEEHIAILEGERREAQGERLEKMITKYFDMSCLILRAVVLLPPAQKEPLLGLDEPKQLEYLLGLGRPSNIQQRPTSSIKRRQSMMAERTKSNPDEEEEKDGERSPPIDPKRRRLNESRGATSVSFDLPKQQQLPQQLQPVIDNAAACSSTASLASTHLTSTNSSSTAVEPNSDLPPPTDRLSLGAHLSPIPSTTTTTTTMSNHLTSALNPLDFSRVFLDNPEYQDSLVSHINRVIAPVEQQQHETETVDQQRVLSGMNDHKVKEVISLAERDPMWDEIIQTLILDAQHGLSAPPSPPPANEDHALVASTPHPKKVPEGSPPQENEEVVPGQSTVIPREIRELLEGQKTMRRMRSRTATVVKPATASGQVKTSGGRKKKKQQLKASKEPIDPPDIPDKIAISYPSAKRTAAMKQPKKANIIANELYTGKAPAILNVALAAAREEVMHEPSQPLPPPLNFYILPLAMASTVDQTQQFTYATSSVSSSSLNATAFQSPTPTVISPSKHHQRMVIKPPTGCNYPMFNPVPNPILMPVPVMDQQVEYFIPMPTPQKDDGQDQDQDVDITIGDSLSKLLIPHANKRQRSPGTEDEEENSRVTKTGNENPSKEAETENERGETKSADKENNEPESIPPATTITTTAQTPTFTSIVNKRVKCSSTPRKAHVRALFGTPVPSTVAKMDGAGKDVKTPVLTTATRKITRSASKLERATAAVKEAKEVVTPRVPKTIKKRILNGVEEQQPPSSDKHKRKESPKEKTKATPTESTSVEVEMKKLFKEKSSDDSSLEDNNNEKRAKKTNKPAANETAAQVLEGNVEPEVIRSKSDLEQWNEMKKQSQDARSWESAVRVQMSQLPVAPRAKRKPDKRRKAKKGDSHADAEEECEGEEEKEKVDDTLDREMQKFLEQPDESLKDGEEEDVSVTDSSKLEETMLPTSGGDDCPAILPNLDVSVQKQESKQPNQQSTDVEKQLPTAIESCESKQESAESKVYGIGGGLPNLNPVTPGPEKPVKDSTKSSLSEDNSKSTVETTEESSAVPAKNDNVPTLPVEESSTLLPPISTAAVRLRKEEDSLARSMSPKKRILHKTRTENQTQLDSAKDSPTTTAVNTSVTHISPPSSLSLAFNHSKVTSNDSHLYLETPFKSGLDIIPKTPGFVMPHKTPLAKIVKMSLDQSSHVSLWKCPEIPTPDCAITPGFNLTPPSQSATMQGETSTAKRTTDYSSGGSSYYRPDDPEETKQIEARLTTKVLKRAQEVIATDEMEVVKTIVEQQVVTVEEVQEKVEVVQARGDNSRCYSSSSSSGSDSEDSFSSSSSSSSSSSDDSSSESSAMDISDQEANATMRPRLFDVNWELDENNEIRYLRGASATPRKNKSSVECGGAAAAGDDCDNDNPPLAKTQSPKVTSSSQTAEASRQPRKAVTRLTQDSRFISELEEKKRRVGEKLKNKTPLKKVSSQKIKAAARQSQQSKGMKTTATITAKEKTGTIESTSASTSTGSISSNAPSAAKRKSSTPRKVMLIESMPLMSPINKRRSADLLALELVPSSSSTATSTGRRRSMDGVQRIYQNVFGDFSDSETDPTPVKRGELETRTPKMEEKYKKLATGRVSGEKDDSKVAKDDSVKSQKPLEKNKSQRVEGAERQKESNMAKKTAMEVDEVVDGVGSPQLMGPPRARFSDPAAALKTPESQIMSKKKTTKEAVTTTTSACSSSSSSKQVETKKNQHRNSDGAIQSESAAEQNLPPGTLTSATSNKEKLNNKAPPKITRRRATIALTELPNEGALLGGRKAKVPEKKSSESVVARGKKTIKGVTVVPVENKKATEADESTKPKSNVFRIPKTKVANAREDGEIVEDGINVERTSEIPEEEEEVSAAQRGPQCGNKQTTSTNRRARTTRGKAQFRVEESGDESEAEVVTKRGTRRRPIKKDEKQDPKQQQRQKEDRSTDKSTKPKEEKKKKAEGSKHAEEKSKESSVKESKRAEEKSSNGKEKPKSVEETAKKNEEIAVDHAKEEKGRTNDPVIENPEEEGSESEFSESDYEMVTFTEESSNFFKVQHDPEWQRSLPQPKKWDPKAWRMKVDMGEGQFVWWSVSETVQFGLPGSGGAGAPSVGAPVAAAVVAANASTSAGPPLISVPKLGQREVKNVLDYLHPK